MIACPHTTVLLRDVEFKGVAWLYLFRPCRYGMRITRQIEYIVFISLLVPVMSHSIFGWSNGQSADHSNSVRRRDSSYVACGALLQLRQTREILRSQEERSYKEREYELRRSDETRALIAKLQESVDSLRSFLPQFDASPRNLEQATAELHEVVQILRNQTADVSMKDSVAATDNLHVDKEAGIGASDEVTLKEDRRVDNKTDASEPGVVTDELAYMRT